MLIWTPGTRAKAKSVDRSSRAARNGGMGDTVATGDAERVAVDGWGDCDVDDAFDAADPPPGEGTRGGRMLVDLADVLRGAGVAVEEVDGWPFRARSGAGFPQSGPAAIIVHHTASGPGMDGLGDVRFMTLDCDVKPMANLYLDRGGRWWVCAAGATNTNGKGGPLGPLPQNSANSRVIGIEAGNNGLGEPWPDVMQESYVAGVAALAGRLRHRPGTRVRPPRVGAGTQDRPGRPEPVRVRQPALVVGHGSLPRPPSRERRGMPPARPTGRRARAAGARERDVRRAARRLVVVDRRQAAR